MTTMRYAVLAVALLSCACHGIAPNPLPTSPAPAALTATNILVTPIPGELPIGGGLAQIRIEVRTIDGRVVTDVPVTLSVDGGNLASTALISDATGHGLTTWTGTASATVRATSATASGEALIKVNTPIVLPPPSVPPPPTPVPPPDPPPAPAPPALTVTVTSLSEQVALGSLAVFRADITNLHTGAGETVLAYTWSWGDKTPDETTTARNWSHTYATDGIQAPKVTILTSEGRITSATGRVVIYIP
jgi:hypothetical protein